MRIFARLLFVARCCLLLFVVGAIATIYVMYPGPVIDNNTGAQFAGLVEAVFVGLVLAVAAIPLFIYLSKRIRWFRSSN
jgi:hypothetical protein